MTDKAGTVLVGYFRLSSSDRREILEEIRRHERASSFEQRRLVEAFTKKYGAVLGPLDSDVCPCCGK